MDNNLCENWEEVLALFDFESIELNPVFITRSQKFHEPKINMVVFEFLYFYAGTITTNIYF